MSKIEIKVSIDATNPAQLGAAVNLLNCIGSTSNPVPKQTADIVAHGTQTLPVIVPPEVEKPLLCDHGKGPDCPDCAKENEKLEAKENGTPDTETGQVPYKSSNYADTEKEFNEKVDSLYAEKELQGMATKDLFTMCVDLGVDPADHEGANTNKKLRLLVLANQGETPAATPEPQPGNETKENAEAATTGGQDTGADDSSTELDGVTIEDIRDLLPKKVQANRDDIKAKLTEMDAKNVTQLDKSHYADFYDFLNSL